jgi:CheY-like chemotaxis protein
MSDFLTLGVLSESSVVGGVHGNRASQRLVTVESRPEASTTQAPRCEVKYSRPGGPVETLKTAPVRVLVTDDEPAVLNMLRDLLTAKGYEVMAVTTGAAALAAVPRFLPDVFLVDIGMPGLSGPQVLEALRGTGSKIPVIAMSGVVKRPMVDGLLAFLETPFNTPLLLRTIAKATGRGAD